MILKVSLGALVLCACSTPSKPVEADGEPKRVALVQIVERVVVPTVRQFALEAEALEGAVNVWRDASEGGPEQTAAQAAFKTAFLTWQRVEMMAFGPAGKRPTYHLGQGLRDTIYAWPTLNPCRVDSALVEKLYAQPGYAESALVTNTGLVALEQLLFAVGIENTCPPTAPINTEGSWSALSAEELRTRRAEYASVVAAGLTKQAQVLRDAWVDEGVAGFASAGQEGSVFATAQVALNEVFAAMFSGTHVLKDDRIGVPAGLVATGCSQAACPELTEALPSRLSREAIVANLEALTALLRGDFEEQGHGFDALLESRGAGSLVLELAAAIEAPRARAAALGIPIDQAVVEKPDELKALYAEVKAITTLLKSQFNTVLSLQVPAEGAGDAD